MWSTCSPVLPPIWNHCPLSSSLLSNDTNTNTLGLTHFLLKVSRHLCWWSPLKTELTELKKTKIPVVSAADMFCCSADRLKRPQLKLKTIQIKIKPASTAEFVKRRFKPLLPWNDGAPCGWMWPNSAAWCGCSDCFKLLRLKSPSQFTTGAAGLFFTGSGELFL